MTIISQPWQQRIGHQRELIWRGWQTRYSYLKAPTDSDSAKPPLVLVHGFGASIEHWRNNIPVLANQHSVYALDLLGFGASRKARTDYTIDLWVEQLHDWWQTIIQQPVILIGNSIGSLVCMNAAAKYPEMAKGLVMVSLPDAAEREKSLVPLQSVATTIESILASPWLIRNILKIFRRPTVINRLAKLAYEDKTAINDELVQILSNPAYDEGADWTFYRLFRGVRTPGYAVAVSEVLPQLQLPILLIWGKCDRVVPPKFASLYASLNPQIELIELPKVGHCPHDENPDQFNQIILNWLQKKFDSELK